jgi:hypothetical protein
MLSVGTATFTVRDSAVAKEETNVTKHARVANFRVAIINSMLLFFSASNQLASRNPLSLPFNRGGVYTSEYPYLKKRFVKASIAI